MVHAWQEISLRMLYGGFYCALLGIDLIEMGIGCVLFHKFSHEIYWTFPKAIWDFGHLLLVLMTSLSKDFAFNTKSYSFLPRNTFGRATFEWNLHNLHHLIRETKEDAVVRIVKMRIVWSLWPFSHTFQEIKSSDNLY